MSEGGEKRGGERRGERRKKKAMPTISPRRIVDLHPYYFPFLIRERNGKGKERKGKKRRKGEGSAREARLEVASHHLADNAFLLTAPSSQSLLSTGGKRERRKEEGEKKDNRG